MSEKQIKKRRVVMNRGFEWDREDLIKKLNEIDDDKLIMCEKCYDENRSNVPMGSRFIEYAHLWDRMKLTYKCIRNKTILVFYKCSHCGNELIEKTTYVNGKKGMSRNDLIEYIERQINYLWKLDEIDCKYVKNVIRERNAYKIEVFKEIYDLLKGNKK